MGEKIRDHIRSNVIGYVALFVALSGTAYAVNTVGSADIIDESILSQDIKNGEVKNPDFAGNSISTGKIVNGEVRTIDVLNNDLTGADIANTDSLGSPEIGGLSGVDIDESSLEEVPLAALANTATTANNLDRDSVYVNTTSTVVPGGSQDDSNGNGISEEVFVHCDLTAANNDFDNRDIAVGGGAFWSNNANSNSDELENRIHSATFINRSTIGGQTNPATDGDLPAGYRVRGEVDKDGNDTLTVQVVCFPAEP